MLRDYERLKLEMSQMSREDARIPPLMREIERLKLELNGALAVCMFACVSVFANSIVH